MSTNLLQNLIEYLKNPIYKDKIEKISFIKSIYQIIRINLLAVLVSFLAGIVIVFISSKTNALDNHAVGDFIQQESLLATFIFACVVAPLLEETAFRLWLVNKPINLALGISAFLFYYISSFVPGSIIRYVFSSFTSDNPFAILGLFIFIFIASTTIIYKIAKLKKVQTFLNNLFIKRYKWIFYSSAFLFGLLHITNYDFSWTVLLIAPILVLPQLSGGVLLSYIRVTYGFWRGVFGHFLYNLFLLTPSLVLKLLSKDTQTLISDGNLNLNNLDSSDKIILSYIGFYFVTLVIAVLVSNVLLLIQYLTRKRLTKSQI